MIGSYIGFILLWGAFISIGLFISALTESQMIAAIVTFGVLLLVFYMDWIAANISNAAIQKIVTWFSLMSRYEEFQNGILNTVKAELDKTKGGQAEEPEDAAPEDAPNE